jgi:hypothetical protein
LAEDEGLEPPLPTADVGFRIRCITALPILRTKKKPLGIHLLVSEGLRKAYLFSEQLHNNLLGHPST